MRWFKHYSDATTSDGLSRIILDLGFEGYGRYWALLEFLAFKFDGEDVNFSFHPAIIRETLRIRSWNKLGTFLERFGNVRGMEVEWTRNEIKFHAPILLELKNRDFKTTRSEREQNARKRKNKKEIKNNTSLRVSNSFVDDVIKLFNSMLAGKGKIKPCAFLSSTEARNLIEIKKQTPIFREMEAWEKLFENIQNSSFLQGANDRNFVVSLGWLMDSDKLGKVYHGQYSDSQDENSANLFSQVPGLKNATA